MRSFSSRIVYLGMAAGTVVGLCAAAPQGTQDDKKTNAVMRVEIRDVGPLGQTSPTPGAKQAVKVAGFQDAPVPNEDVEAPAGSVHQTAQLAPKLLWPSELFQGEGYARGSSQQTSQENRKSAAAGLRLIVPVSQQ